MYNQYVAANMKWPDDENFWKSMTPILCIPMSKILRQAFVTHVDFFILDVEGAEYDILQSIDWDNFSASVLCIETEVAYRPPGYAETIRDYLAPRGYIVAAPRKGRNTWFMKKDFVPYARPGLPADCYRGLAFMNGGVDQPACQGYKDLMWTE